MQKQLSDYLDNVGKPIRNAAVRAAARQELSVHVLERYDELRATGLDETGAAGEVVRRMGDPLVLGARIAQAGKSRRDALAAAAGAICIAVGAAALFLLSGGQLPDLVDGLGFIATLLLAAAFALLGGTNNLTPHLFFARFKYGALFGGALSCVMGIIVVLMKTANIALLGINIAVALLSLIYALVLFAAGFALERLTAPPRPEAIRALLD